MTDYSSHLRRVLARALSIGTLFFAVGCSDPEGFAREAVAKIAHLENSGQIPKLDQGTSIAGTDTNGNGVRDDIAAYIAAQPLSEVQKKALLQGGRAFQQSLTVPLEDKAAVDRIGRLSAEAINCIGLVFEQGSGARGMWITKLEAMTANTRQRAQRYLAYNKAASGSFIHMPSGDTCER